MRVNLPLLMSVIPLFFSTVGRAEHTDGLIAQWRFDSCDATDDSGNGHHGVIRGAPQCIDGVMGRAFAFSPGHYIEIPTRNFLEGKSNLTIVSWFNNRSRDNNWHQLFSIGDERAGLDPVTIQFSARGSPRGTISLNDLGFGDTKAKDAITFHPYYFNFQFESDLWYLIAVVLEASSDASTMRIYVNDKRIYTVSRETVISISHDIPMTANIGAIDGGTQGWQGDIDELTIYGRALSLAEVQQLYYANPGFDAGVFYDKTSTVNSTVAISKTTSDFTLVLGDLDQDADLDLTIFDHSDDTEFAQTVWLHNEEGYRLRAQTKTGSGIFKVSGDQYRYEIRTADLDEDDCLDAFIVHPLDGRERWIDDGVNSFIDGGSSRVIRLSWPASLKAECLSKADPQILQQVLSEASWSYF